MSTPNQNFNLGQTGSLNAFGPGTMNGASGSSGGTGGGGGIGTNVYDTLTGQQHQIANQLQGNLGAGQNLGKSPQSMSALNSALTANPLASLSPQATAKNFQNSVATPLLRQYEQTIMPRLNDSYAAAGALMGSRRGFANQQSLQNLQGSLSQQLANSQQQNAKESASLQAQMASTQGNLATDQQKLGLGYGGLAAQLTGQPWMAIQPYVNGGGSGSGSQGQQLGGFPFGGLSDGFSGTPTSSYTGQFGGTINGGGNNGLSAEGQSGGLADLTYNNPAFSSGNQGGFSDFLSGIGSGIGNAIQSPAALWNSAFPMFS